MRYDVEYRCSFEYEPPAAESHNELRVVPATDDDQVVQHARVTTTPGARARTAGSGCRACTSCRRQACTEPLKKSK